MEPWSWLTEGVFFTKWPVCFGNKCVENTWACYKNYDMFLELRNANYISSEIMKYEFRFVCFSSLGIYHMWRLFFVFRSLSLSILCGSHLFWFLVAYFAIHRFMGGVDDRVQTLKFPMYFPSICDSKRLPLAVIISYQRTLRKVPSQPPPNIFNNGWTLPSCAPFRWL